jgi:hypothetical protein
LATASLLASIIDFVSVFVLVVAILNPLVPAFPRDPQSMAGERDRACRLARPNYSLDFGKSLGIEDAVSFHFI